jgi:glycolate oxidase FAD binding subunit
MSKSAASMLDQSMTHLAVIVGHEHTRSHGKKIIVSPRDLQQIVEILRFAHANRLIITPKGGGTKVGWGNPVAPDIQLDMERLRALREHTWQDMTCTVEAGCLWASMQAELRRHRQMVALDPLWPDRATVGGIVASNDSGALRLKFGGLRDHIIGMTIVLSDGTIARTGGKVVKNVAGYDLHKLLTGSFGTLGVIAEVNFRLHPVEEHVKTWTAVAPDATPTDASSFAGPLDALMDSQMTPSCVQLRVSKQECAFDIRVTGVPEFLEEYAHRIQRLFGQSPIGASSEAVWEARQQLFNKSDALVLKASMLPTEICFVSSELQRWAAAEGHEIDVVAQATGLMTIALSSPPDSAIAFIQRLRNMLFHAGGKVVVLQLPDSLRGRVNVWGPDPDALPLMREIKRRFDPERILNPGRFVGGI